MKIPILVSLVLALLFALAGWHNHAELTKAREDHKELLAEASKLGIRPDGSAKFASSSRRDRPDRGVLAQSTAADLIVIAREFETKMKEGGNVTPDDDLQSRVLDIMERMASLDASQIQILIDTVRTDTTLGDQMRTGLIYFAINNLANSHPKAALELLTASSDMIPKGMMAQQTISSALGRWAKESPDAALAWVRANQSKFPDLIDNRSKKGLITGTATNDPRLAFSLIKELGMQESDAVYADLARTMREPEKRDNFLKFFREHVTTLSESKREAAVDLAMRNLFYSRGTESFASFASWFDSTQPSPAEIQSVSAGVLYNTSSADKPAMMDWVIHNLSVEKSESMFGQAVAEWTREDYQAAGQWLVKAPEGPAKNVSVSAYAETVAPYEPRTAEQWALTLPAGKDRDTTLKKIFQSWPGTDKEGKAAFAEKHGIK